MTPHHHHPLPHVLPEGMRFLPPGHPPTLSPLSSASSLPSSRRLPKAPVFIWRGPAAAMLNPVVTLIDDDSASAATSDDYLPHLAPRLYDFDDDFPSIAASESTHPKSRTHFRRRDPSRHAAASVASVTSATRYSPPLPHPPTPIPVSAASATSRPPGLTQLNLCAHDGRAPLRHPDPHQIPDASDPCDPDTRRVYAFSDDFASIAGSGSTSPLGAPTFADRGSDDEADFARPFASSFGTGDRTSFAGSFKRRISLHQLRPRLLQANDPRSFTHTCRRSDGADGVGSSGGSYRREGSAASGAMPGKAGTRSRSGRVQRAATASMTSENPNGCASFIAKLMKKERSGNRECKPRFDARQESKRCSAMMDERKVDDVQFISILAYDEFMHSPNRTSAVAKVFSRLRRA